MLKFEANRVCRPLICQFQERTPYKSTFPTTSLTTLSDFSSLAHTWGEIAANAHARSSGTNPGVVTDSLERAVVEGVGGKEKEFLEIVEEVAVEWARGTVEVWRAFKELVDTGL